MTESPRAALLVVGEPGADPSAALATAGAFDARFYAPAPGRADDRRDAPRVPPDVVALAPFAGGGLEAALGAARRASWLGPLLVMNAGERAAPRPDAARPRAARSGRGRSVHAYPVLIRIAGGSVRHVCWFGGRRPIYVGAPHEAAAAPRLAFAREPGNLGDVTRALIADALAAPLPAERIGTAALLVSAPLQALRLLASGGWRDGFRGTLLSLLHGLHWLVVLARAWRAREDAHASEPS